MAEERIGRRPKPQPAPSPGEPSRYEPLDVPAWVPFWLGALLAFFVVAVLVVITIGYPLATHQQNRGPMKELPPAPRLETAPMRELQAYEVAKARELSGARAAEPIDQAMRDTAKQGWGPPK